MGNIFNRRGGWTEFISKTYRSGLEEGIAQQQISAGVPVTYERYQLKYEIPSSWHTYTPDFILPNGIIIESKGIFQVEDRQKHLFIKKQYPNLDIRFVFSNPSTKLYKQSRSTYASWCTKNGFLYARKYIPAEWFQEGKKDTTGLISKKGET